jgi:5-hydroxyisourate hydrolase
MASISTHVLDTSRGRPAAGVTVELHACHGCERRLVVKAATDSDGRVARDVLTPGDLPAGVYELTFHAGDYFRALGSESSDPPFLDNVVVRFGIADGHHHVPLLLSPFGYSTYRGS